MQDVFTINHTGSKPVVGDKYRIAGEDFDIISVEAQRKESDSGVQIYSVTVSAPESRQSNRRGLRK